MYKDKIDMDTKTNTSGTSPEVDILMEKVLKGTADRNDISILREWLSESEDNQRLFKQKCTVTEVFEPNFNPDDIDTEKALSKIHRQMRKSVAWRKFASHFAAAVIPLLCVAALYFFCARTRDTRGCSSCKPVNSLRRNAADCPSGQFARMAECQQYA